MKRCITLCLTLTLTCITYSQSKLKRPQTPTPPFTYTIEEVAFTNTKDSVTLSGTFTYPKEGENFPVAILISGSGPQNRDEEIFGHKPFWVLADYLTKQGIAILRYDDRGTDKSSGDFKSALTKDFATDAGAAIDYLKSRSEINKNSIGLIGHSEGGIVAPMVASERPKDVAFIVLLAGVTIPGAEVIKIQKQLTLLSMGSSEAYIQQEKLFDEKLMEVITTTDLKELPDTLTSFTQEYLTGHPEFAKSRGMNTEAFTKTIISGYTNPWFYHLLNYDPGEALDSTICPILALNGMNDTQVPYKENLEVLIELKETFPDKNITTKAYPKLNHLFQESETGAVFEYGRIEQTIAPYVMADISEWIKKTAL